MSIITASVVREMGSRFYTLRLKEQGAEHVFRFGGLPPTGIHPIRKSRFTAFLLTLPFSNLLSCSLFTNLTSIDPDSSHFVFSAAGQIHDESSHLIEVCWHKPILSEEEIGLPHSLPALAFELGEAGSDPTLEGSKLPDPEHCFDHHKIGGFPYFHQPGDAVIAATEALIYEGFHHHFQLAFPGPDDANANCDWPFGELVLNVFAKPINANLSRWEVRLVWS